MKFCQFGIYMSFQTLFLMLTGLGLLQLPDKLFLLLLYGTLLYPYAFCLNFFFSVISLGTALFCEYWPHMSFPLIFLLSFLHLTFLGVLVVNSMCGQIFMKTNLTIFNFWRCFIVIIDYWYVFIFFYHLILCCRLVFCFCLSSVLLFSPFGPSVWLITLSLFLFPSTPIVLEVQHSPSFIFINTLKFSACGINKAWSQLLSPPTSGTRGSLRCFSCRYLSTSSSLQWVLRLLQESHVNPLFTHFPSGLNFLLPESSDRFQSLKCLISPSFWVII